MRPWGRKFAGLFALLALFVLIAGCDRCGEWLKSEGGNSSLLACKSDGPKPQ